MAMEPGIFKSGNGSGSKKTDSSGQATDNTRQATDNTKEIAEVRRRIHAAVGQVALALTVVPRYRHHSIADLQSLVLEPLMRDRVAIATAKGEDDAVGGALAGIAFWASVSDEVDAKIREQIKGGAFPIKLKPDEWTSGDKVWLFDVIAPSQKLASSVLGNFRQVVKQGDVRIHPMVARMVDPKLLEKMGATAEPGAAKAK
jgi:cytolysin-activating lysine-acyltransferase